jgi:predicted tellurium resistance membrane protein TerC
MIDQLVVFLTLCFLEVVLGIDNILVFSFLTEKVVPADRFKVKSLGLAAAFIMRIVLLIIGLFLTEKSMICIILGYKISISHVFFLVGGLFLFYKSLYELYNFKIERKDVDVQPTSSLIMQIMLTDFVFSLDSILAALALTSSSLTIVASIIFSMLVMFYLADIVIRVIGQSWRFNALALVLVGCIGFFLIAEGLNFCWDKTLLLGMIMSLCAYELLIEYLRNRDS